MAVKTTSLKGLMVEVDLCFGRILAEWRAVHQPAPASLIVWVLCFALRRLLRNEILLLYARMFHSIIQLTNTLLLNLRSS